MLMMTMAARDSAELGKERTGERPSDRFVVQVCHEHERRQEVELHVISKVPCPRGALFIGEIKVLHNIASL